ncbi:MAG: hypothetical protein NVSMB52_20760 [Chloroflexota bacterium]
MVRMLTSFFVAAVLLGSPGFTSNDVRAAKNTPINPIQRENKFAGTGEWKLTTPATHHEIEGYASLTSVLQGGQISFSVSTSAPAFNADIYRLGWYGGLGARLMQNIPNLAGHQYPVPPLDPTTRLVDCNWPLAFSLTVPALWTSGLYLVKLTTSTGLQSFIPFVVRSSGKRSPLVFIHAVNTEEAYNLWGGASLYYNTTYAVHADQKKYRAYKVSFNRPFEKEWGAGQMLWWEDTMVRWLERKGYDITYVSDVDVHEYPELLLNRRGILVVGHSEYWTKEIRDHVESAVKHGVNLGVFASNTSYFQIRYEPSGTATDRNVELIIPTPAIAAARVTNAGATASTAIESTTTLAR